MDVDEAFRVLGIYNKNISSDELREVYQVKLNQNKGYFNKKKAEQIRLANQIVRNYRQSQNWIGSTHGSFKNTQNIVSDISARPGKDSMEKKRDFWRNLAIALFVLLIIICFF